MEPHQQRVIDEKKELDDKRERLSKFFTSPVFDGLDRSEQARLQRQKMAMDEYSFVLGQRIEHFT